MTFGTRIHRVSAYCCKGFQGQGHGEVKKILRGAVSLYLADGFQQDMAHVMITWVGIVEKILKVRREVNFQKLDNFRGKN